MDGILPIPQPDWNNPQPYDAPTLEETEAVRHLQAGVIEIQAWVTASYVDRMTPHGWRLLGERLTQLGRMCGNVADDTTPSIGAEPDHDHQP